MTCSKFNVYKLYLPFCLTGRVLWKWKDERKRRQHHCASICKHFGAACALPRFVHVSSYMCIFVCICYVTISMNTQVCSLHVESILSDFDCLSQVVIYEQMRPVASVLRGGSTCTKSSLRLLRPTKIGFVQIYDATFEGGVPLLYKIRVSPGEYNLWIGSFFYIAIGSCVLEWHPMLTTTGLVAH